MIKEIVKFILKSDKVRIAAEELLAVAIAKRIEEIKRMRRAARREKRRTLPYCKDCALFGTFACGSRNVKGWCSKWTIAKYKENNHE